MKVKTLLGYPQISGQAGDLVYCINKRTGKTYARRYEYPTLGDNHHKMGGIAKNLFKIQPSDGFKYDCRNYAYAYATLRNNRGAGIWTWSNCFLHLMYAMAKRMPDIDLSTLTREEIYSRDLPCISIKRAVEAGLLDKVNGWEMMEKEI